MEFTEELELRVQGCSITSETGLNHGSVTWTITGPIFLQEEFPGTISLLEVLPYSFHRFEPDSDVYQQMADISLESFEKLMHEQPENAFRVLPRFVRAHFMLTMSSAELVGHLMKTEMHTEAVRVLDDGLMATLEEYAPGMAGWVRQSRGDGVLPASSDQEKIANQQEVQDV